MKSLSLIQMGVPARSHFPVLKNLLFACMLFCTWTANAATWYVNTSGSDANAGTSWATAFLTVQKALASASSGDEIWVAAGTYYPDEGPGVTDNDRDASFIMKAGVAIYGGFPTVGNPVFGDRDLNIHVTTLSGDLMQDDGANFANNGDNSIHVIWAAGGGITATAILDGFTVTAGNADGSGVPMVGGGMLISNASPKIDSCLFTWNQAKRAGAMFIWSGPSASPTITNCTFSWNNASSDAGGAVRGEGSSPTFDSCIFSDNSAGYGGGIDLVSTIATITNCTFLRNTATGYGGGLSLGQPSSSNIIDKCVFAGNQAPEGGGIRVISYSATITNCLFLGNKADNDGGGINATGGAYTTTAINCTFSGNSSPSGGALYASTSSYALSNCILWGNSSEITTVNGGSATVTNSIVEGGYAGVGNLDADPLFVSQPDHTAAPTTAGDLHLQSCSPAINAGTNTGAPTDDLDANARPFEGTTDMGAYEFQSPKTTYCCPAGNVVYVNASATGANTGQTWTNAFTKLQSALDLINSGECSSVDEIWVATGTYYPDEGPGVTDNDRTSSFNMLPDVALYGGFPATGNPVFGDRNWNTYVTTLSGDLMQDDGANFANNGENAYQVVLATNGAITSTALLDGFTLTGGNANTSINRGGGMYISGSADPTVRNCRFMWNATTNDGGGIAIVGGSGPIIDACTFIANQVPDKGAGVYNINGFPTITNSQFYGNKASNCSGFFNQTNLDANPVILFNCSFSGNSCSGGVIRNEFSNVLTITNCLIWGNLSGVVNLRTGAFVTVNYSIVQGGHAGIDNLDADPLFVSQPDHTTAPTTAGDLHLQSCSPAIDAGTNTGAPSDDLEGNARPHDGDGDATATTDMGAYEFQGLQPAPVADCQNQIVELNASGTASLDVDQLNNGSTGCAPLLFTVNNSGTLDFTCADKGVNTYTLTVTDALNSTATCIASVTVNDNVLPAALCQNLTVELNGAGTSSITPAQVDNGSSDACGIQGLFLSKQSFDCSNVGANTVTLTVTDNNGNTNTCTANITVNDNVLPTALCQNLTVELNGAGTGSITPADVNNGFSDACGIQGLELSKTNFDCSNVGANTVTLTVTDVNGNTQTCTATITVNDNVLPTALCQNLTVELNGVGMGSITVAEVNTGSSDACGIQNMALSRENFNCSDLGTNTVTLTVTDVNGKTNTCSARIVVQKTIAKFDVIASSFCTGDTDATVKLNGSETDVTYQLRRVGGGNIGAPKPGTGAMLDFGMQAAGSYTVIATSDICGNTAQMNGPAEVRTGGCGIIIPNYCSCNSPDGRAEVTLKVMALPGQNWKVKAVIGLYDLGSPAAPSAPTPLAVDTPLNYVGNDMYSLDVLRLNDKGYWVQLTNGDTDLDVMVGNASW